MYQKSNKQPLSIINFIPNRIDFEINILYAIKINLKLYLWLADPKKWHTLQQYIDHPS